MPFQKSLDDTSRPELDLRVVDHDTFSVLQQFVYVPPDGALEPVVVPAGLHTDLASVPRQLWGLLPSYGRQLRAAIMHDHLCKEVRKLDPAKRYAERRDADELFRLAMRDAGNPPRPLNRVTWARAWLFWAGVAFGRYWEFRKVRCLLLVLHVLAGVTAAYGVVVAPDGAPWTRTSMLAAYVALLVASIAWWSDARLPLIGIVVSPVVLPVLLVTFSCGLLIGLPDAVLKLADEDEPPPRIGPANVTLAVRKEERDAPVTKPA
jgi:hypothetical protein